MMKVVVTARRRQVFTASIVAASLLAIAAWSESRSAATFATMSVEHAVRIEGKEDSHLRAFRSSVDDMKASEARIAWYSAGVVLLCFAAFTTIWLPSREEESNQALATVFKKQA